MATPWQTRFAQRNQRMGRSVIRELLKLTEQPDVISFAGGLPAPELFPTERCQEAAGRVLAQSGRAALQYGVTEGYMPLRQLIADEMARHGARVDPKNVLITNGSQQGLDLLGKLLINPGDRVLVEEPTYLGALQAWNAYQAEYLGVPIDADGMRIDLLNDALRLGPKMMYVLPNFQNPGGTSLSLERRQELVRIANRVGVPIVEDDPYGSLRYAGDYVPSLLTLDAEYRASADPSAAGDGLVVYLGTFSKTLAPGLRLGWVAGPTEVIEQLVSGKQGTDLNTSTFAQMMAYEVARDGFLEEHIQRIRAVYGERRTVMLDALAEFFPPECSWTRPDGGLFIWIQVPDSVDTADLMVQATQRRVAYVPGFAFYADSRQGRHAMRLNFSYMQPDLIVEGIHRLGDTIKEALASQVVQVQ